MRNLDSTMMALADPTRRAILRRLARGEARVTELAQPFAMSLNAVSKHIMVLERAGLVRRRKSGRDHFLRYEPRPLDAAAHWMDEMGATWKMRLEKLDAILTAEEAVEKKRSKR